MKSKFEKFLVQLKTKDNKGLLETIEKGFKAIHESYADVREERVDALSQFNEMATMTAQSMGNGVLSFLRNSAEGYNHLYTVDDEPELDNIPTSEFRQYSPPKVRDEMEDNLGLTAGDLLKLNS